MSKTKTVIRARGFKPIPAPDYFHISETVKGLDDQYRALTIIQIEPHICSECFQLTRTDECPKCKRFICDACSDWTFRKSKKVRVIDVKCPCRKLLYNDFY